MKAAAASGGTRAGIEGSMAVLIVSGSFLRVAEGFVSFSKFFEFVFRRLVSRVLVRMILEGELAIGFLDLLLRSLPLQAENFIIVPFRHRFRLRAFC
jgi:hypothetical protein